MLRQARQGPVIAKANAGSTSATIAASLQGMNVRRAICIPVELSGVLFGFLYLDDSRLRDEAMLTQTASISVAVARMAAQHNRPQHTARIGTEISNPDIDFAKLAQSMGVWAEGPISDPAKLGPALQRAIAIVKQGRPALVDAVCQGR